MARCRMATPCRSLPDMSPAVSSSLIIYERTDILGKPVKQGDRIVWSYVSCGSCYYCSVAMQPCICSGRASWGHNRSDQYPYLLGSCAEYMYVPPPCLIIKVEKVFCFRSGIRLRISNCHARLRSPGAIKSHESVVIQGAGRWVISHRWRATRRKEGAGSARRPRAWKSPSAWARTRY